MGGAGKGAEERKVPEDERSGLGRLERIWQEGGAAKGRWGRTAATVLSEDGQEGRPLGRDGDGDGAGAPPANGEDPRSRNREQPAGPPGARPFPVPRSRGRRR